MDAGSKTEQRELLDLFMAAVRVIAPEVTEEQRLLVEQVVERMLRERSERADGWSRGTREGS